MLFPHLLAGIEQWNELSGYRVNTRHIRAFAAVAAAAGQSKVFQAVVGHMLFCMHMVNLESLGGKGLGKAAVFATVIGAFAHESLCGLRNHASSSRRFEFPKRLTRMQVEK